MYSETWKRLIDESLAGPKGIYELIALKRVQGVVEEWERQSMPAHACSGYFGFGVWVDVSAWESGEAIHQICKGTTIHSIPLSLVTSGAKP